MTTVTREVKIDAPVEKVWKILADFGGIYKFNPGVPNSYSTSQSNSGVGATRHCDFLPTGGVEERITEWNENSDYKIEIYEGKGVPPFKTAVAHLSVAPDDNGTIVKMSLSYRLKFGPLGALMDAMLVRKQFQKAVPGILAGLRHYTETGETVDSNIRLDMGLVTAVA